MPDTNVRVRRSRRRFFEPQPPVNESQISEFLASEPVAREPASNEQVEVGPRAPVPSTPASAAEPTALPQDLPLLAIEPAETDLGPLTPLLAQPDLTDIFVNGPRDVWYEAAGSLRRAAITFPNDEAVRALATRLILSAGGRLDDAYPAADVQTAQGIRTHALLPPLSRSGTLLSLRLQPAQRPSLRQLQERGMLGRDLELVLRYLVRSRANLLVSGGTGTGKTTLLGALLQEADAGERLLLVEDTSELHLDHPHAVSLQARAANAEGQGEVGLAELIRQALRMRPNRLVVGECRGGEVMDMLTAMNTGHAGSGTTVHANSAQAVPARLYAMGALAGVSSQAVALQAATALDYIVHLEREKGQRLVRGVYRLTGAPELAVEPICTVEPRRRGTYLRWHPGSEELCRAAGLWESTEVGVAC